MLATQAQVDLASQVVCLPLSATLNFSLFQYLLTVFHARHREPRVRLLLCVAFLSFATLVPVAYPDQGVVHNLADMSRVCSVLTFTLQISILTSSFKKIKLPAIVRLGRVAELLVILGLALVLVNFVELAVLGVRGTNVIHVLDITVEYVALLFVTNFRFYFLSIARGWAFIWAHQKLELLFYLLLLTHAAPFQLLSKLTGGLDWTHVQGLWLRVTIALCLSSTIRAKLVSLRSSATSKKSTLSKSNLHSNRQAQRSIVSSNSVKDWSASDNDDAFVALKVPRIISAGQVGTTRLNEARGTGPSRPSVVRALIANRNRSSTKVISTNGLAPNGTKGIPILVRGMSKKFTSSTKRVGEALHIRQVAPARRVSVVPSAVAKSMR